ncbi:AAA family ATPase [Alloalcanivorax xenomutans]|uniref:AAA family ATPase n=1 Tax=Alloalcanivorax xenomutans TaxID=1094342 RepID=UPI003D9B52C2
MSVATLVIGESGTGKSASMRNLSTDDTLLIQTVKKPLPFRAADWKGIRDGGNVIVTADWQNIIAACQKTQRKRIVIDDFQYLLATEFMARANETGFQKFTDLALHAWEVFNAVNRLADDVRVYILSHTQTDDTGHTRFKTLGKLLDEKITVEGLFSIVLRTHVEGGNYQFRTQNSGSDTVKSPMGLFDGPLIDNDLAAVDAAICDYYGIQSKEAA